MNNIIFENKNDFLQTIGIMNEIDITNFLYGLFLGDGYLHKDGMLYVDHTIKQNSYCLWLKEVFDACNLKVYLKENYKKKTTFGEFEYTLLRVKVPNRKLFEEDNKCYDLERNKIVSDYVLYNISTMGLLLWYLDDGSLIVNEKRSSRFAYLNTQSFTYNENLKIVNMFKERFDIDLKIHTDSSKYVENKKYYRIYFSSTSFCKFIDLVRNYIPYLPKELLYKFDMKYKITSRKNSKYLVDNYNIESLIKAA